MDIQYIPDHDVNDTLDRKLRKLLSVCFTNPQDAVFKTQRYFNELPQHRWYVCDQQQIVAHVALHEKTIRHGESAIAIGGIAEVCVHPDHRRQGWVGKLLAQAHAYLQAEGIPFSVLYGETEIYGSTGYRTVDNLLVLSDREPTLETWISVPAMVLALAEQGWPEGPTYLDGKTF